MLAEKVGELVAEFGRSSARELHIRSGDFELFLSADSAASSPLGTRTQAVQPAVSAARPARPAPSAAAPPAEIPDGAEIVRAPSLGTFYRAPKPGATPFVEVGDEVSPEMEICLVEVMKLFTAVRAGVQGRIHAVLVEDGAMVEAGQPLFAILGRS
jgi:acetyl-CoA carboxylase biotin carboxyl carrier protein